MQETIILAPGVNESELLRTMARFGKNTIGVRVLSTAELAKRALIQSGRFDDKDFLSGKEAPAVFFSFLKDIPYFASSSYADAENIASTLNEVRMLLTDASDADEEKSLKEALCDQQCEFPDKNNAVFEAYQRYMKKLQADQKEDSISLIRAALSSIPSAAKTGKSAENETGAETGTDTGSNTGTSTGANTDYVIFKEFPLKPLEKELICRLSGDKVQETSLADFIGKRTAETTGNTASEITYTAAYGAINEVNHIISTIYKKNLPLDSCAVACASTAYAQLFREVGTVYGIPMTFGTGLPVSISYPAILLKRFHEWETIGFYGIDALRRLLKSEAFDWVKMAECLSYNPTEDFWKEFDQLTEMAGELRVCCDKGENEKRIQDYQIVLDEQLKKRDSKSEETWTKDEKHIPERIEILNKVRLLAKELENEMLVFLKKYTKLRADSSVRNLDRTALNLIEEYIGAFLSLDGEGKNDGEGKINRERNIDPVIEQLMGRSVSPELCADGAIHITTLIGATSSLRANLFVCGLSSGNFPGSPKEDYLVLDNDYREFEKAGSGSAGKKIIVPTSDQKINATKESFTNLIDAARALNVNIYLSYPSFDLASLKKQNPSSVLFDLYAKDHPGKTVSEFKDSVEKVNYFGHELSKTENFIEQYVNGKELKGSASSGTDLSSGTGLKKADLTKEWSPSRIGLLLKCPRRFYLECVEGIPNDEEDDPFEVMDNGDFGTLVHTLMEILGKNPNLSENVFEKTVQDLFADFLKKRPAIHVDDIEPKKKELLKVMMNAFSSSSIFPKTAVCQGLSEKDISGSHKSGLSLHGLPDRVMIINGKYVIVDFKTGRNAEHTEDDLESCFQALVYAWLVEQNNPDIKIHHCEFWYLRLNQVIKCRFDQKMRDDLDAKLNELKDIMVAGVYNREPGNQNKNCMYCRMKGICEWESNEMISGGGEDD